MIRLMFGDPRRWVTTRRCTIRRSALDGDPALTSAFASVVGAAGVDGAGARIGSAVQSSSTTTSSTAMDSAAALDSTAAAPLALAVQTGYTIQIIALASLIPTGRLRDASRPLRP